MRLSRFRVNQEKIKRHRETILPHSPTTGPPVSQKGRVTAPIPQGSNKKKNLRQIECILVKSHFYLHFLFLSNVGCIYDGCLEGVRILSNFGAEQTASQRPCKVFICFQSEHGAVQLMYESNLNLVETSSKLGGFVCFGAHFQINRIRNGLLVPVVFGLLVG